MFKAYNLEINDTDFLELNKAKPISSPAKHRILTNSYAFKDSINSFDKAFINIDKVIKDNTIDGDLLINEWFPEIEADIFLSHSHDDESLAIQLATWIEEYFDLKVFIDSTVWKYADELLALLDKEYCYNEEKKSYIYEKRNYSTAHVHLMLSTALANMIDRCECLFFLNTPSSISIKETMNDSTLKVEKKDKKTHSPWVYNELFISSIIERKYKRDVPLFDKNKYIFHAETTEKRMDIAYTPKLSHLEPLNKEDFLSWQARFKDNFEIHPLDNLYFNNFSS